MRLHILQTALLLNEYLASESAEGNYTDYVISVTRGKGLKLAPRLIT